VTTIRVGHGVPGRRRTPGWARDVLAVGRAVMLALLLVAVLQPAVLSGTPRVTHSVVER
jgi:hypothetical protein